MKTTIIGWVSPDGEFIECEEYDHIAVAEDIVEERKLMFYSKQYGMMHGEQCLEELGWIKFTQSKFYLQVNCYPDKGYVMHDMKNKLTTAQKNWMLDNINKMSPVQQQMSNEILKFDAEFHN